MNTSARGKEAVPEEKLPMDGSEGPFHDVSIILLLIFIFCRNESEGCWKLSHKLLFPLEPSCKIRFPLSVSSPLELAALLETFDDQRISCFPFKTTRLPSSDIFITPEESPSGLFLLATHIGVISVTLLYHIPTYLLVELTGLKNPSL
uniref:Serine/threonine-protein kinase n=1 Tax=Rhizophora mucronata TaxID=61149 RepID=A0A2P2K769_RHIMU